MMEGLLLCVCVGNSQKKKKKKHKNTDMITPFPGTQPRPWHREDTP